MSENQNNEEVLAPAKKTATSQTLAQIRSFVAGGVGGICAVVIGHPFDLVKVRMQTAEKGVYTGAIDVVKKTIAREGLARGLYAGVSAPLVGVTPMCKFPCLSIQIQHFCRSRWLTWFPPILFRQQLPSAFGVMTWEKHLFHLYLPCLSTTVPLSTASPKFPLRAPSLPSP